MVRKKSRTASVSARKTNKKHNRLEKLAGVVNGFSDDQDICILITQVDLDAIAAGVGLSYLLENKFNRKSKIYYCGAFGRFQSKYIRDHFNLDRFIKSIKDAEFKDESKAKNAIFALVDSCSSDDSRLREEGLKISPTIVIDHHLKNTIPEETDNSFILVEDVGAASTLVVELLKAAGVNLGDDDNCWLATVLALGIYSDTKNMVSAGKRDRDAFAWVADSFNVNEMTPLINYPFPEGCNELEAFAIKTRTRKDSRVVAGIGTVEDDLSDFISILADRYLRTEGVVLVATWALIKENPGQIRISVRCADASFPLGDFMRQHFGPGSGAKFAPDRHGESGARFYLSFEEWLSAARPEAIHAVVDKMVESLKEDSKEKNNGKDSLDFNLANWLRLADCEELHRVVHEKVKSMFLERPNNNLASGA